MKKNFIKAANALMFGAFAMSSLSLASCADDNELNNTAKQEVAQDVSSEELEGAFICPDQAMKLSMLVKGNNVTFNTPDASAQAQVTYSSDGNSFMGEFASPFKDIKSFEFKKVGAFYHSLQAQMVDGTQQEFAFYQGMQTRAANVTAPDIRVNYLKGVMKKGLTVLTDLHPYSKIMISPFIDLLFTDTPEPDMTVKECYENLSQSISEVKLQIANFEHKYAEATELTWLYNHNELCAQLEPPTRNCLAEILSLRESNSVDAEAQIKAKINEWGRQYVDMARKYLYEVYVGTPLNMPYPVVVDHHAETIFPWEHQGYDIREQYRLHELNIVAETGMMMLLYGEENPMQKDDNIIPQLEYIAKVYKDIEVKRDTKHAICQINGANHVKIDKSSFGSALPTTAPDLKGNYKSIFKIPDGISTETDLGFLVVPTFDKDKNYANDENFKKWKEKMMTTKEAEAIMNYYGNKKTMYNILRDEADIRCPYFTENDNYLFLYGTTTSTSNRTIEGSIASGTTMWGSQDVYLNEVCYVNRTSNAFDKYHVGRASIYYHEIPFSDNHFVYNGWKRLNIDTKSLQLFVDERENGWVPGHYLEKK